MRIKNNTQRFEMFVRDMQESFWGDFQGRTRETLRKLLETDSEQQMAEYLGLKWHERAAGEAGRIDYRNGFYAERSVSPWIAGPAVAVGDHGRLSGPGGDPGRVPASAAPALLGAQDAKPVRGGAPQRSRRSEAGRSTHLSSGQLGRCAKGIRAIPVSLAHQVLQASEAPGAGSACAADVFRVSPTPLAQATHHQCH